MNFAEATKPEEFDRKHRRRGGSRLGEADAK